VDPVANLKTVRGLVGDLVCDQVSDKIDLMEFSLYLIKKQFSLALPLSLLRCSRLKSASISSGRVLRLLQISSTSVHFTFGGVIAERVNTVETHHELFPIFG